MDVVSLTTCVLIIARPLKQSCKAIPDREQAGDSDAGERGGTVEQAPLSPLLRAAIDAFDEAGPDAAFEQGLAVIVDGLAKRRLVVRNVEGPRKGDD